MNGQLHRNPDEDSQGTRLVVLEDDAFDAIVRTHQRLGHPGYKKTFAEVQNIYYGIYTKEVCYTLSYTLPKVLALTVNRYNGWYQDAVTVF